MVVVTNGKEGKFKGNEVMDIRTAVLIGPCRARQLKRVYPRDVIKLKLLIY